MTRTPRPFPWLVLAVACSWLAALGLALHARFADRAFGFPLDDAWIHLTYARTLAEHGQWAYFPGDPLTAGSTAPLFTLLEAALFRAMRDEKLLAIVLGLAAHLGFLVALARWARARLGDPRRAALAVALAGLDGRIALLAVSGMETSLFLALLALALERRIAGRALAAGLALGLALWVRPDTLVLAAVLAVDAMLARAAWRDTLRTFGAFALLAALYAAYNHALGGHWLPATFAAKTAFYAERTRLGFVTGDLAECFLTGGWIAVLPFALGAIVAEAVRLARGRAGALRLEAGWAVALPLAYLVLLPYAHRFTRYLVPALPAMAVLGVAGMGAVVAWANARRSALAPVGVGVALALAAAGTGFRLVESDAHYRYSCLYHADRHERTGRWLAAHTPADAVIATHDVGAIAFYSRRRIFDTVGLVSPEVIPWIGSPSYTDSLAAAFARHHVTAIAAYDEWLPVDNVRPAFEANPEAEVMRVFPWRPERTRLVPRAAIRAGQAAAAAFARGDGAAGMAALRDALARDPGSSRWWVMLGDALARAGRVDLAAQAWRRAQALFPDSPEIAARLAAGSGER